jgi:hypothetical protein
VDIEEVDLRPVLPRFINRPQEYIRRTLPEYESTFAGRDDRRYFHASSAEAARAEIERLLPQWKVATVAPVTRPPLRYKALVIKGDGGRDVTTERAYSVAEARALVEKRFPTRRLVAVWEATLSGGTSEYPAWKKRMEDWGIRVDAEGTDEQPTCFGVPSPDVLVPMWTPPPPIPGWKRVYRLEYAPPEEPKKHQVLLCEMPCLEDAVRWYWKVSEPGRKGWRLCDVSFDHREPDEPASINLGDGDFLEKNP